MRNKENSFTIIEMLIYLACLGIFIVVIFGFLTWLGNSNTKIRVMRETLNNAQWAMDQMTYAIRGAKSIYTPTTTINPPQLSIETTRGSPDEETATYVDFFLCGTDTKRNRLCMKKESQDPVALTSNNLTVSNLAFTQIISGTIPSIQIDLKIDYNNPNNRSEYQSSVELSSTISMRAYGE